MTATPDEKGDLTRRCLFCGADNGSSPEHILGAWLAREIGAGAHAKHYRYSGHRDNVSETIGHGATASYMVKGPCDFCNTSWMSRLEDIVQRLLLSLMKDEAQQLDRIQQRSIAMWLAIKSMVWEYRDEVKEQRARSIPQSDRDFVYLHREPAQWVLPDDWYVWISRSDAAFGVSGVYHVGSRVIRTNPDGSIWPHPTEDLPATVHCWTAFSGAFVGLVMRTPFGGDGALFSEEGLELFRPIWPITKDRSWPLSGALPHNQLWALPQNFVDEMVRALG